MKTPRREEHLKREDTPEPDRNDPFGIRAIIAAIEAWARGAPHK